MAGTALWGFVAGSSLAGALCGLSVVVALLIVAFRRIDRLKEDNTRLEGIIDQLAVKTKAIDPVKSALDDEGDFQNALMSTRLLMGYINRKSPGALKLLLDEEFAPHRANPTKRGN